MSDDKTEKPRIIVTLSEGKIQSVDFQGKQDMVLEVRDYDLNDLNGTDGFNIVGFLEDPSKYPTFIKDKEGFYYNKKVYPEPPEKPVFDIDKVG